MILHVLAHGCTHEVRFLRGSLKTQIVFLDQGAKRRSKGIKRKSRCEHTQVCEGLSAMPTAMCKNKVRDTVRQSPLCPLPLSTLKAYSGKVQGSFVRIFVGILDAKNNSIL